MSQKLANVVLLTMLEQIALDLESALLFPAPPRALVQKASDSLEDIIVELRKYNAESCAAGVEPMAEMRKATDDLFKSWSEMTQGRVKC